MYEEEKKHSICLVLSMVSGNHWGAWNILQGWGGEVYHLICSIMLWKIAILQRNKLIFWAQIIFPKLHCSKIKSSDYRFFWVPNQHLRDFKLKIKIRTQRKIIVPGDSVKTTTLIQIMWCSWIDILTYKLSWILQQMCSLTWWLQTLS